MKKRERKKRKCDIYVNTINKSVLSWKLLYFHFFVRESCPMVFFSLFFFCMCSNTPVNSLFLFERHFVYTPVEFFDGTYTTLCVHSWCYIYGVPVSLYVFLPASTFTPNDIYIAKQKRIKRGYCRFRRKIIKQTKKKLIKLYTCVYLHANEIYCEIYSI